MLFLILLLSVQKGELAWRPSKSDPHQSIFDTDGARMAARVRTDISKGQDEPLLSRAPAIDHDVNPWRPVTDATMRSRSGYWAPVGYRYHRSARADLDRDGLADMVELVENGKQSALRITYAAPGKQPRIVARSEGVWASEGVFRAGPNAVMINYPESRVYFMFQRGDEIRARFVGD